MAEVNRDDGSSQKSSHEDFEDAVEWQAAPIDVHSASVSADAKISNELNALLADKSLNLVDASVAEQTLLEDLRSLQVPVDLYLNSHFQQAESMLQQRFKKSLYCLIPINLTKSD
jgi:hypothetical protein